MVFNSTLDCAKDGIHKKHTLWPQSRCLFTFQEADNEMKVPLDKMKMTAIVLRTCICTTEEPNKPIN